MVDALRQSSLRMGAIDLGGTQGGHAWRIR